MFTLQNEKDDKMWFCWTWHKTRTLSRVVGSCQSIGRFAFLSFPRSIFAKSSSTSCHQPAHMTTSNVKALTFAMRLQVSQATCGSYWSHLRWDGPGIDLMINRTSRPCWEMRRSVEVLPRMKHLDCGRGITYTYFLGITCTVQLCTEHGVPLTMSDGFASDSAIELFQNRCWSSSSYTHISLKFLVGTCTPDSYA